MSPTALCGIQSDITLAHEREWELYHNAFSLCSKKVRVCLEELGIPYAGHHVDLIETGSYENVGREYLAINPSGLLPVLVHRGHPVYESHEQIVYAAAHAPADAPGLVPDDPDERQLVEHWVDCASLVGARPMDGTDARAGHCIPGLTLPLFATMVNEIPYREIARGLLTHPNKERPLIFATLKLVGLRRLPRLRPALAVLERSRRDMGRHLDALARQLDGRGGPWIAGERFTLADVGFMVILDRLVEADWAECLWGGERRPAVAAYWQRLSQRPSYSRAVESVRCPATRRGMEALRDAKCADGRLRAALEGAPTAADLH